MPKPDCSPLAKLIAKLALNIGSRPEIKDVDGITAEMRKHIPEITRKEVVNAINDATAGGPQNLSDLQKKLGMLKREAKTDAALRTTIGEYQKAVAENRQPQPPAKPTRTTPEAITKLRDERDALKEKLRASAPSARAKVAARIAELDAHLKGGTAPPKSEHPAAPADLQALRDKRDELMRQVREASPRRREEIKDALKEQIQELNRHIADGTRPAKMPTKNAPQDVAELRSERDRLHAQLNADSPEKIGEIQSRIDELEGHLKAGTLPAPKVSAAPTVPDKVAALRTKRDELMSAIRKSDPSLRQRFEQQIAEMTAKIEGGDISLPEPRVEPKLSSEIETLRYQRDRLRTTIRRRIDELRPKSFWTNVGDKVGEPINLARSLVTSMDFSAVLRQGGFVAFGNPVRAVRAFPTMFRAFASPAKSHAINEAIQNRPNAPLYQRSKLYLAPEDGALGKQEESFMSRLAGKIPLVAGSQRAYVTFLNKLRADTFDAMTETLARNGEPTRTEAAAIANYINIATGRGSLGPAENNGAFLNTVFFAPRYFTSRLQLLAGSPMHGGTARTRKLIATEYAKAIGGMGIVYALGKAAGGTIESDPKSSDFGKIRLGNTRIDPLMGLAQITTLVGRLVSGQTKKGNGAVVPIRGPNAPFGGTSGAGSVGAFLRSKLSPVFGTGLDIATGKDVVGQPVTVASAAKRMLVPISFQDIGDVMREHGYAKGTMIELVNLFGMGVQNYGANGR